MELTCHSAGCAGMRAARWACALRAPASQCTARLPRASLPARQCGRRAAAAPHAVPTDEAAVDEEEDGELAIERQIVRSLPLFFDVCSSEYCKGVLCSSCFAAVS